MQTTQSPETLYGSEVMDSQGKKVGTVDGVWLDDATGQLEFVGVKTGWLMGKTHIIPVEAANMSGDSIQVPYDQSRIKDAPSFSTDQELSPTDEDEIYGYYGIDRSTAPSPSGLGTGAGDTDYGTQTRESDRGMTLSEEQLQVGKQRVETGRARLRKVVRTEQVEQPVELQREEVNIERVPVSGGQVPGSAFQDREIEVPVSREEPVVGKTAQVTGEVRVNKNVETETRNVGGEIRREDVEVDEETIDR